MGCQAGVWAGTRSGTSCVGTRDSFVRLSLHVASGSSVALVAGSSGYQFKIGRWEQKRHAATPSPPMWMSSRLLGDAVVMHYKNPISRLVYLSAKARGTWTNSLRWASLVGWPCPWCLVQRDMGEMGSASARTWSWSDVRPRDVVRSICSISPPRCTPPPLVRRRPPHRGPRPRPTPTAQRRAPTAQRRRVELLITHLRYTGGVAGPFANRHARPRPAQCHAKRYATVCSPTAILQSYDPPSPPLPPPRATPYTH